MLVHWFVLPALLLAKPASLDVSRREMGIASLSVAIVPISVLFAQYCALGSEYADELCA